MSIIFIEIFNKLVLLHKEFYLKGNLNEIQIRH